MFRILAAAVLAAFLIHPLPAGSPDTDRERERAAKKQREKLESLSSKLARRLRMPNPSPESIFLHERSRALLETTKASREDLYRFFRLAAATDALLEASERIFESREPDRKRDDDDRRDAAQSLQRDYFRVQQAEYFARQSKEPDTDSYVKQARSLYHQARKAFDQREYRAAEKLGDAASYVVRALEHLAQAAVPVPEPPKLD